MNHPPREAIDYLRHTGMLPRPDGIGEEVDVYLGEMERKLADPGLIREMMPSFIAAGGRIATDRPVIAVDAGGTNLRVAVVTLRSGAPATITRYSSHPMPGSRGRVGKREFFDACITHLAGVIDESDAIGVCFSYPLVMNSCRDGRLLQWSKQIDIDDIVDTDLGSGLRQALVDGGHRGDKDITLLNDSTSALLSGLAEDGGSGCSAVVGFILGTGMNMAYAEDCRNIAKLGDGGDLDTMIINMEGSRYDKFPRTPIDVKMDRGLSDPDDYPFDKMVGGKYLGLLSFTLIRDAVEKGVFSPAFAAATSTIEVLETRDLVRYWDSTSSSPGRLADLAKAGTPTDRAVLDALIESVVERAARYCAAALCAVIRKSCRGNDTEKPIRVVVEGGTYRNFRRLRERMHAHMEAYFAANGGMTCEFVMPDNAALVGAAVAALLSGNAL